MASPGWTFQSSHVSSCILADWRSLQKLQVLQRRRRTATLTTTVPTIVVLLDVLHCTSPSIVFRETSLRAVGTFV